MSGRRTLLGAAVALAVCACIAVTVIAVERHPQSEKPAPAPTPQLVRLGDADAGRTVTLRVGSQIRVTLSPSTVLPNGHGNYRGLAARGSMGALRCPDADPASYSLTCVARDPGQVWIGPDYGYSPDDPATPWMVTVQVQPLPEAASVTNGTVQIGDRDGAVAPPTSDDEGSSRTRRYHVDMATHRADEPNEIEDPIHEEVRRVMADPRVKARLAAWKERKERGELPEPVPANVVRKIVGLPPLPDGD